MAVDQMKGQLLIPPSSGREARRRLVDGLARSLISLASVAALVPLGLVLYYVVSQGAGAINWAFFTQMPKPVGETGGGMANAIMGSLMLIGLACLIGLPFGLLGGIFVAEFPGSRLSGVVRFAADVLNGVPSIVVGLVAYAVVVVPMGRFSAFAGNVALAIMTIPIVLRTTDEMMRMVPDSLREASLALGAPQWRTTMHVVFPAAQAGIVTGIMLALARIAGETAPLLFTALGNRFWSMRVDEPIAALPLMIYQYAVAPYDDWHRQAWAASLVLVTIILTLSVLARWATGRQIQGRL